MYHLKAMKIGIRGLCLPQPGQSRKAGVFGKSLLLKMLYLNLLSIKCNIVEKHKLFLFVSNSMLPSV